MFFSAQEVRRFHVEDATEELLPARALLVRAEVPFICHVEVGDYATSVAECARKEHCSYIILQDHRKGAVSRLVLGSLTNRVRQLVAGSNVLCELI
jgi:nucleotide-binding universal stress UspA family protein